MMLFQKTLPFASLTASLLFLAVSHARADVRYTTNMSMGAMDAAAPDASGMKAPMFVTTTFVKDMRERVERSMQIGPIQSNTVTLTMCDKHQTVTMSPAAKVYMVEPIGVMDFAPPKSGRPGAMEMPGGAPGKGHVVTTLAIQDLGMEKVANMDARHVIMTVRIQSSGCIGTGDTTMKMEQWVAPLKAGLDCPERFAPMRTVPNEKGCQITYEIKGDVDKMRAVYGGMVVRQIIYSPDTPSKLSGPAEPPKPLMRQELRDYSLAALSDSLFAIPADYKEVTPDEYHKAEQQAMMHALMGGGMPGMSGDTPAAPDAPTTPDAAPPTDNGQSAPAAPPASDNGKKKRPKFHIPGLPF